MKTKYPLRLSPAASAAGMFASLLSLAHAAPVVMNGAGSYSQDFDTLINTGTGTWTDDTTISGWYSQRTGTGTSIVASIGNSNSGALYSFGAADATDRALGTVGSGGAAAGHFAHGLLLQNTGATSVTINSISYHGEQWRSGAIVGPQVVPFSYKVASSAITALDPGADTTWTLVPTLDFSSPENTLAAGPLDGNTVATTVSTTAAAITVPAGQFVMLRWRDVDHGGSDHGLAIDDVSLAWVVESQPSVVLTATPADFAEDAGATAATGTVTIPAALGSDLVVTLASSDTTEATVPATVKITAGNTSANFDVAAVDDFLVEANPLPVNLTASADGYTNGQFQVNVADDGIDTAIGILITPDTFSEAAGDNVATGTVQTAEDTDVDLIVTLTSLDTTEVTVPATVTILAGTDSITFPVNAVNDAELDGTRTVTILAGATGYTQGSTTVMVEDDGDVPPQPTLEPGDIAIVGMNADVADSIAFVPLVPITAGDTVLITDNEWNGGTVNSETGDFVDLNEGTLSWTAPAEGVPAGTVVLLSNIGNSNRAANIGTLTAVGGTFDMTVGGDTFYVYQGAPLFPTGFITAFTNGTMESIEGTGLTENDTIAITSGADIGAYSGPRNTQPTFAGYFALIRNTATHWTTQDAGGDQSIDGIFPDVPFSTTAFTLGTGGNYDSWATDNGIPGELAGDDFDKDGLSNLLEYAMGLDPTEDSQPVGTLVNGLLTYPKGTDAFTNGDVTWKIQTSTTLAAGSWQDVTETETDTSISFQLTLPPPPPGKIFARLEVTQVTP